MKTRRTLTSKLDPVVLLLVSAGMCSCAALRPANQNPTFDRITLNIHAVSHEGGSDQNQWLRICEVLNRYGRIDCANFERSNCQQVGSVRVCDFDSIALTFAPPLSLTRLVRLHNELLALKVEGISLGLTRGSFAGTYTSLASQGSLSIRIRIAVTPGTSLFVERRYPGVCERVATQDNVFFDEVTLRPGQEWIYYRTELKTGNELVRRYFRLSVSSKLEQELSRDEFERMIGKA